MSSRQWLSSAMRQCKSQQPRAFSTAVPVAAGLRSIFGPKNNEFHGLLKEGFERGNPLSEAEQRQIMDQQAPRASIQDLRGREVTEAYVRQMPRRWRTGEVYAPKDLSPVEMKKFRQGKRPNKDVVDMFGFNPLDNYRNFSLISEFMTSMGRIKHSSETGLRPVNQRKMAKAIRRAIGMGLHPSVHKHPEILRRGRHGLPTSAIPTPTEARQNVL
ncbi:ribosomal protein S18 [Parathielavia appendiculata]|uniref:Small ribosomal subunit protein bS18m n=1 Tax=Parathielavia appendiculata TaxID=2587402 RepID=A0AAN6TYV6_9PEZI|nr:ribosomal protein S18 [Parathielavia appendiculata]